MVFHHLPCPGSSGVEQWIENPRVGGSIPPPGTTSTLRNFVTISSGFGRLFAIHGPPFPKHSGGPVQWGRLIKLLMR